MLYINQLEHPHLRYVTRTTVEGKDLEYGRTSTVKSSGCGLCSAVMVADRLLPNCNFGLYDAIDLSYEVEANHKKGTDYHRFAPAFAEKLGLLHEMTADPERLLHCLRTGGAAVVLVKGDREGHIGVFSHGGHYVAAIAEEPDGRLAILDPSYKENKYEEEGRQGKVELKYGVVALCDIQVLIDDCPSKDCFHLFWRE